MSQRLPKDLRNVPKLQKLLKTKPESFWIKRGETMALRLFHEMAERVPAYKDFLKQRGIDHKKIRTIKDFQDVPIIDKDNYLRQYPRQDLCWDGKFANEHWVISTTSGSTGEPYYFPRTDLQDEYYALTAELYLRSNFDIHHKSTLYIVAFPMGAWIGGLYTYEALHRVAQKGYSLSVITPGIHKQEVINAVKQLGKSFDQIIIGAYAPFLKDILDDGTRAGIVWGDYDIGFVFSAEAFTEKFRDFVLQFTKPKDALKATLNHYGTVDLGTMAHETPESIMVRRELVSGNKLDLLFPEKHRQPTFAQYNPELFYFESENNNLLCSAFSGIPLVRYDLKDYGGVITKAEAQHILEGSGYNVKSLLEENHITDTVWNLPFVYVYERNDFSVSYYAFLIYPDMIRRAFQADEFTKAITGKFTMLVDYSDDGRQQLNIHSELKYGVKSDPLLVEQLIEKVHSQLLEDSSEYRETVSTVGGVVKPIITLWPYEDTQYFRAGTKQKWVVK